jgi:UTP--glucose-1-phosphate uridylyltransferase
MLMTGESYDCGKKMGYMQAFVTYGMRNLKEGAKFYNIHVMNNFCITL